MSKLNDIKEKLNSVVFMGIGVLLAIISILIMFAPGLVVSTRPIATSDLFWGIPGAMFPNGAWPVFMGYMFIVAGAIALFIISLPIITISAKVEKILLFTIIGLILTGGILVMCLHPIFIACNPQSANIAGAVTSKAGPYVSGSFAILSAGCAGIALAFDW